MKIGSDMEAIELALAVAWGFGVLFLFRIGTKAAADGARARCQLDWCEYADKLTSEELVVVLKGLKATDKAELDRMKTD